MKEQIYSLEFLNYEAINELYDIIFNREELEICTKLTEGYENLIKLEPEDYEIISKKILGIYNEIPIPKINNVLFRIFCVPPKIKKFNETGIKDFYNKDNTDNIINSLYEEFPFIFETYQDNIVLAGGSLLNILENSKLDKKKDLDIFLINSPGFNFNQCIEDIFENLGKYIKEKKFIASIVRTNSAITFTIKKEEKNLYYIVQIFQFILRAYNSVSQLLHGFDIGACSVALHEGEIYLTERCLLSICTRQINVDYRRFSESYFYRLIKYSRRGFYCYTSATIERTNKYIIIKDEGETIKIDERYEYENSFLNFYNVSQGRDRYLEKKGIVNSSGLGEGKIDSINFPNSKELRMIKSKEKIIGVMGVIRYKYRLKDINFIIKSVVKDTTILLTFYEELYKINLTYKTVFLMDNVQSQGYYTNIFHPINVTIREFYLNENQIYMNGFIYKSNSLIK